MVQTTPIIELTESERDTLTNALYVAAERFGEHFRYLTEAAETHCASLARQKPTYLALAAQFAKQAVEAHTLAERLGSAEFIRVGAAGEDTQEAN